MRMMKKAGSFTSEEVLSRIEFAIEYDGFEKVDLISENIPENYEAKKALYKELKRSTEKT